MAIELIKSPKWASVSCIRDETRGSTSQEGCRRDTKVLRERFNVLPAEVALTAENL